MGKGRRHHSISGRPKARGTAIGERNSIGASKRAIGTEDAREREAAGRKTALGNAPREQHAPERAVEVLRADEETEARRAAAEHERQAAHEGEPVRRASSARRAAGHVARAPREAARVEPQADHVEREADRAARAVERERAREDAAVRNAAARARGDEPAATPAPVYLSDVARHLARRAVSLALAPLSFLRSLAQKAIARRIDHAHQH